MKKRTATLAKRVRRAVSVWLVIRRVDISDLDPADEDSPICYFTTSRSARSVAYDASELSKHAEHNPVAAKALLAFDPGWSRSLIGARKTFYFVAPVVPGVPPPTLHQIARQQRKRIT